MKNVHWIQGGNQCESPLFRRSFLLQQVSQSAKIEICRWGCAVYVIPMNYYKVYGDSSLLEKGYPAIIRWLNYMEKHCKEHLVVREETGGWCLGEWCAPASETETLPEAFVNTYYYIQGLEALKHMAEILHEAEPTWVEERIRLSKKAFEDTYFNMETDDFCNGIGGAKALH